MRNHIDGHAIKQSADPSRVSALSPNLSLRASKYRRCAWPKSPSRIPQSWVRCPRASLLSAASCAQRTDVLMGWRGQPESLWSCADDVVVSRSSQEEGSAEALLRRVHARFWSVLASSPRSNPSGRNSVALDAPVCGCGNHSHRRAAAANPSRTDANSIAAYGGSWADEVEDVVGEY